MTDSMENSRRHSSLIIVKYVKKQQKNVMFHFLQRIYR